MYACLAVTCHLHFWQNDLGLLRATAVTRGWNGYRNKSQHRKSTLEKKILPPFQQGFEPATFQSRVRCSNHWAIPAPFSLWPVLFSYLCISVRILGVLKIVCGWAIKTWLLPYAYCGLRFIDSAACVLSFDHSTPLHITMILPNGVSKHLAIFLFLQVYFQSSKGLFLGYW